MERCETGADARVRLPQLNENQLAVMAELAAVGGRMRVRDLRQSLTRWGAGVYAGDAGEAWVGGD